MDGDLDNPNAPGTPERLESWKQIAFYLNKQIRTVQRWEKTEDLPVRRHVHGKMGSVYAYKHEIDEWRAKRELADPSTIADAVTPPLPVRRHRWAAVLLFIAAAAGIVTWWRFASFRPLFHRDDRAVQLSRLLSVATSEGARIQRIPVGKSPQDAVITPDEKEIYVSNSVSMSISVIQTTSNTVSDTIPLQKRPIPLAMGPDCRRVYVATYPSGIVIIDTGSKKVTLLPTEAPIQDISISPDGQKLYAAIGFSGLFQWHVGANTLETVVTPKAPVHTVFTPDGKRLYINYQGGGPNGRPGHDTLDVMDPANNRITANLNGFPNVGGPLAVSP